MTTETTKKDLAVIKDEEILRKLWQDTEDFGKKKEIRSQMYKLREERLKNFYDEEIKSSQSNMHMHTSYNISEKKQQTSDTQSHADALKDHSFMSLKSKEIRDSSSPSKDTHNHFKSFLADASDKSSATIHEITNDGNKTTKKVQSGSMSATKVKDNNVLSTCSANYEDVTYSSEKDYQNNDNVKTKDTLRNTFNQQNESGKNDSSASLQTSSSSSMLSSTTVTSTATSIGADINQTLGTDNNNYQKKPVENVTTESYTTPDGITVTTQTFHYQDGTRVTKTKREKTERTVSNVVTSTGNAVAKKSEANEVRGLVVNQKALLNQETITSKKSTAPKAEKLQTSNIETSQVNILEEKSNHIRGQTDNRHHEEINILHNNRTSDAEKAAITTVKVNIEKSNGNVQVTLPQDSKCHRNETVTEFSNSNNIETNSAVGDYSELITDKKSAVTVPLQNDPDAIVTDTFPITNVHQTSTNRKSEQKYHKVTDFENKDTELIKGTGKNFDTTYRNDYCSNSRISVESTPSHQYFASTLRSSSSDCNKNKSNSIKSSSSSLRSSSSPERKLSPHSREVSPAKSTRSGKEEKLTYFSTHARQQHKTLIDTRRTSKNDIANVDIKSVSRSASPAITDTNNFEFVKIDSAATDDDSSSVAKRYDIRGTSVDNVKKINKIEERSYSSPISTNIPKSPMSEKAILRRKDTYEERCKEILGISQNNIKNYKSEEENLQISKKQNCLDNKTVLKSDFSTDLIRKLKQTEEQDINEQNIRLRKTIQECDLKDKPQMRLSPGKGHLTETKLTDGSSPKPDRKSPLKEGKTQIKEFPSQVLSSPEKKYSPDRNSMVELISKSETSSRLKEKKSQIKEFPSQIGQSPQKGYFPERELRDGSPPKTIKKSPLLHQQPQIKEFPSQIRRSPEKEYSPERCSRYESSPNPDRKSPLKEGKTQIKEFPSQIRRSLEKEYSPERQLKDKSSPKPHKSPFETEKPQIKEFPSQIQRSPEKEYCPKRYSRNESSPKPDKKSPLLPERAQIKEFPSQIRRSPEKKYSPERQLKDKSYPKPDKKSPFETEKPQIKEFPSQLRRSPENGYSPEREARDGASPKPDKRSPPQYKEFTSQTRRSPEKKHSPVKDSGAELVPESELNSPLNEKKPQIKEFPSQMRHSPEKEYSPETDSRIELIPKPRSGSPLKEEKSQIKTFPLQIGQSPKRESRDGSSSKTDKRSPFLQEQPQIKEFPYQTRRSPEKEYSPEKHSRVELFLKSERSSPLNERNPQINEFPSQIRRSSETEYSPERDSSVELIPKRQISSPLKEENPQIKGFHSQIRQSPKKEYSPERDSRDTSSPKPDKRSPLLQERQQPKPCKSSSQISDQKTTKKDIHKHAIKGELIDTSSSNLKIKSSLKHREPEIKEFPSQTRQSPEKKVCEKSSLKFDRTINLSALDVKSHSQSSTLQNRKLSEKKSNDEKIDIVTNKDIKNLSKITTKNQPSAEIICLNELSLQNQLMAINSEPVHYNDSKHKTVKKGKPVGSPYPKQLEKEVHKSNAVTNKENELIKVSLDRMNYKNMKPVVEPKAVKKFVSLLYEAEEDDRKSMKKTSVKNKTIDELESEITEKKKAQASKVVSTNRIDIHKKRPDSKLNKMETEVKITIRPKAKATTLANTPAKKEVIAKELFKQRKKADTFTKTLTDTKHSNETNARKKIEKVTKIVSVPPYSVKTKPTTTTTTTTTTVQEKTITNLPARHVVTAILPVPPLGKPKHRITATKTFESTNNKSKSEMYTDDSDEKTKINCFTTKSVIVNADLNDEKEVVIKLQRSKSSREPTPDRPSACPCDDDGGIPRYPDQIYEPDDLRCRSEPVNLSEIVIHESEEMAENVSHKTNVNKYDDRDECLLSVNEKVHKFVNEAEKLISPMIKTETLAELNQETEPMNTSFHPSIGKKNKSPVREVIITNVNESFLTPKSSRRNCFSEESKSVLSDAGMLRSNESIRKAKQIFEKIGKDKTSSTIRRDSSSFQNEKNITSMSEDSLDNFRNRTSQITSEKNTSDLKHCSPIGEKKASMIRPTTITTTTKTSTITTHHNKDGTDSSNVLNEKRNVNYSKEHVEKTDAMETLKQPFKTSAPISKQENIKSKISSSESSTAADFSTFKIAVRKFSGEIQKASTIGKKTMRIDNNVEDIYDVELLETLLEQTTDYDLRNKIRTQIRRVKRHNSENKHNFTKITMKNASITDEKMFNCKETAVKTSTKQYDLSEPKRFRESHELIYETKTQKFTPSKNTEQTTEETSKKSKFTRKGSVKEMSKKFIDNAIESCKNEKSSSSYPKAGLILRTTSFNDSKNTHLVGNQFLVKEKSSAQGNSSNTFLSNTTKVTGVHDIINRMRNAENDALDRNEDEDAQARMLLNKFLGCQVLLTGLESSLTSSESRITTIKKTINKGGKTVFVELNFRHPISEKDLYDIWDVDVLQLLLEKCRHFEEQQVVKARLDLVMAEQEERKTEDSAQEINKENEENEEKPTVDKKIEFENESEKDSPNEKKTVSDTDEKKSEQNEKKSIENDGKEVVASATKSRMLPTKTPVSPFAKFRQLDKQSSGSSPSTPNTPTGSRPLFKFTDPDVNKKASTITARLLQWVQMKTKEYENISIDNFSSSWADGLAFCALIHHFLPDAFDYSSLTPKNRRHNFTLAFTVAEEKADIYPLLDVEDMVMMSKPDWKCVFTYVQAIYRRFKDED